MMISEEGKLQPHKSQKKESGLIEKGKTILDGIKSPFFLI